MIEIDTTPTGIRVTRGELDIRIASAAVNGALGVIIVALTDSGKALGTARRAGYEDGLTQGYVNAEIASATRERIAERQQSELVEALAGIGMASAA